jgi:hypothetical protein
MCIETHSIAAAGQASTNEAARSALPCSFHHSHQIQANRASCYFMSRNGLPLQNPMSFWSDGATGKWSNLATHHPVRRPLRPFYPVRPALVPFANPGVSRQKPPLGTFTNEGQ